MVLLAKSLVRLLEGPWISNRQIEEIMALWGNLPERDKAAVSYPERFRDRVLQGRFKNSKNSTVKVEESMKRCVLHIVLNSHKDMSAFLINVMFPFVNLIYLQLPAWPRLSGPTPAGQWRPFLWSCATSTLLARRFLVTGSTGGVLSWGTTGGSGPWCWAAQT